MNLHDATQWIESRQETLLDQLVSVSEINSGTSNLAGLDATAAFYKDFFHGTAQFEEQLSSATAQRTDLTGEGFTEQYGNILRFQNRPEAPVQILLSGHMDTVFPADHPFQTVRRRENNVLHGPGVADMKGGILCMLTALQAFESCDNANQLGWQVVLSSDEETGSLGSMHVLRDAAANCHAGLIYEPALADGTLAGARKGSGNFTVVVDGLAAHAGREFQNGRNAIIKAAELATQLAAFTDMDAGITLNVGKVAGGTALNVVPARAVLQFNVRCTTVEQQHAVGQQINALIESANSSTDYSVQLSGAFTRPPKHLSPANQLLMEWTRECGSDLGTNVQFVPTGGCCDGNNLAAFGLPNIDTLGVRGGLIHTDQEFMIVESLSERAKLSLLLLDRIAEQGEKLVSLKEDAEEAVA